MNKQILFGLSILSSLFAWVISTIVLFWPALRSLPATTALIVLVTPHMFRFIGLSFLLPGVVSESLPGEFARPAAYGDFIAAVLAMAAVILLGVRAPGLTIVLWTFNIWGTADLLIAMFRGPRHLRTTGPGVLGAAFYIPTFIVPGLLLSHALIFWYLIQGLI